MTTSRRQFVKLTAAAGGALGFGICIILSSGGRE
jgi:hypothetical protein